MRLSKTFPFFICSMGAGARKGQNKNKITKEKETFYDKSSDPLFAVFSLLEQAV